MQQTFQCFKCGAQNYVGQPFCWNCQQKFQYNCPFCGVPVDSTLIGCPNCRPRLPWPTQQSRSYPSYDKEGTWQKSSNKTILVAIAVMVIVIIGGSVFAVNYFSKGPSPTTAPQNIPTRPESPTIDNKPSQTLHETPPPEEKKTPTLNDVLIKSDEVPEGWTQDSDLPHGIREWDIYSDIKRPTAEAATRFINDKTVPIEKQIFVNNNIILFTDKQSESRYIQTKEDLYKYSTGDTVEPINVGDGGFSRIIRDKLTRPQMVDGKPVFPTATRVGCFLYFTKGMYYIDLFYNCPSLSGVSDKDISTFINNLAKKIEARIPAN